MLYNSTPSRIIPSLILYLMIQALFCVLPSPATAQREHLVYFPNTAYELNVYKIYGKQPGKTLMLIGGIQGNEPGGFLSADLYADMSLEKGNLIVVPRANFYSILLNKRGPHGDMNRKFTHEDTTESMEDKIVSILKRLIGQSDYLLNLHDGSGYYYPKYIDKWRNPMRFGQSIISDCEIYAVPGTGKSINLGNMAKKVIAQVNPHIKNALYKFHYNNTKTGDPHSAHKEQRKSATYYALTKHHIPAFGVESSKFLPSMDLKIRYHNLIINTFMKHFGIIPEHPGIALDPPLLKYIVLSINGDTGTVVKDKQPVYLRLGDSIHVSHIEANYERGLSLDILGYGDLNDFRKNILITKNTNMIVRKDNQTFAEIPIVISGNRTVKGEEREPASKPKYLVVEARGNRFLLANGETLQLVKGDHMKIVDALPSSLSPSCLKINFKGFVGNRKNNTGEDRGYDINTATDLMRRYSLEKKGEKYGIEASNGRHILARFYVSLIPASFDYLILNINEHSRMVLKPGDTVPISARDEICLDDVRTNLHGKNGFHLNIEGYELRAREKHIIGNLFRNPGEKNKYEALVKKDRIVLGKISFSLE
jgi:hypothetical protein